MVRNKKKYNIDKLIKDKEFVEERFKYEDGAYGHCISLPSIYDLKEPYLSHHNNVPLRGVLNHTPYFKKIFDSFETEITSFRLLRRKAHSSYGLHHDKDMGVDVKRFQIPIIQNDNCPLYIAHYDEIEEEWTADNTYTQEDFGRRFKGRYDWYNLEIGRMYHFDVTKIHTLFNDGDTDRITLLIDLKINDWLEKFIDTFENV